MFKKKAKKNSFHGFGVGGKVFKKKNLNKTIHFPERTNIFCPASSCQSWEWDGEKNSLFRIIYFFPSLSSLGKWSVLGSERRETKRGRKSFLLEWCLLLLTFWELYLPTWDPTHLKHFFPNLSGNTENLLMKTKISFFDTPASIFRSTICIPVLTWKKGWERELDKAGLGTANLVNRSFFYPFLVAPPKDDFFVKRQKTADWLSPPSLWILVWHSTNTNDWQKNVYWK